jgi:hypothetical protein
VHLTAAACRAKAVECVALYAVAASGNNFSLLTSAVQLLGPLVAAGGCNATRAAAVKGLVDIALIFGPAAVDSVLRAPAATAVVALMPVLSAGAGEDVEEVVDGHCQHSALDSAGQYGKAAIGGSCDAGGRGLLELLLSQAEQLLSELQAPAAGPKPLRKSGSRFVKVIECSGLCQWHNFAKQHLELFCSCTWPQCSSQ